MNDSNHPRPGRSRRRRRGRPGQPGGRPGGPGRNQRSGQAFTGPMDHSYRHNTGSPGGGGGFGGGGGGGQRFRGSYQQQRFHPPQQDVEPVPAHLAADAPTRIVAVIDDLFFLAKVQETARKLNVKVDFVKTDKELLDRVTTANGHEQPSLIIVDLNNTGAKPLTTIPKLKSKLKGTSIIGFLSHVQGELKVKAQEAGFDAVMPRSALSQNLAQILRRHGAPDEQEAEQ